MMTKTAQRLFKLMLAAGDLGSGGHGGNSLIVKWVFFAPLDVDLKPTARPNRHLAMSAASGFGTGATRSKGEAADAVHTPIRPSWFHGLAQEKTPAEARVRDYGTLLVSAPAGGVGWRVIGETAEAEKVSRLPII